MKTPPMTAWVSGLKGGTISGAEDNWGGNMRKTTGSFVLGAFGVEYPKDIQTNVSSRQWNCEGTRRLEA